MLRKIKMSCQVKRILNFWFGKDSWDNANFDDMSKFNSVSVKWFGLKDGKPISKMEQKEIDENCIDQFAHIFDDINNPNYWQSSNEIETLYAKMILTDQLSRNCFRKTDRAFQYDSIALECASELFNRKAYLNFGIIQLLFLFTPFEHSEDLEAHKKLRQLMSYLKETKSSVNPDMVKMLLFYANEHTEVIEKFKRYPHRNKALNRVNTAEEEEYLSRDDLPGWTKSQ